LIELIVQNHTIYTEIYWPFSNTTRFAVLKRKLVDRQIRPLHHSNIVAYSLKKTATWSTRI